MTAWKVLVGLGVAELVAASCMIAFNLDTPVRVFQGITFLILGCVFIVWGLTYRNINR